MSDPKAFLTYQQHQEFYEGGDDFTGRYVTRHDYGDGRDGTYDGYDFAGVWVWYHSSVSWNGDEWMIDFN